jgi:hypothetical protein
MRCSKDLDDIGIASMGWVTGLKGVSDTEI